jgi:hypothetical protein
MQRILRTSLGLAAYLATALAHSASLSTGGYVLGSQLASPGSFEAAFTAASAGAGELSFELVGFKSLDGYKNCCGDVFHLSLNGTEVFAGAFNMGGGGSNAILFNPNGGKALTTTYGAGDDPHNSHQVTWAGGVSAIALPITLVAGHNFLTFSYTGQLQGLGDEAWGVNSLAIATPVPEPQTYALMLAGLGALGFIARRRKAVPD